MKKNNVFLAAYLFFVLFYNEALKFGPVTYSKALFLFSTLLFIYLTYKNTNNLKRIISEKPFFKNYFLILIIFFVIVFISFIVSIFMGNSFYLTNIYEILRVLMYCVILANLLMLLEHEENYRFFKKILLLFLVINSIIAITQFFNIFNINELYIKIIAPTQYVTLINGYPHPRVVGLTANPNVFAFVLSLASVYIFLDILKKPFNKKNYVLFLLFHIVLYMTSSRTGYIVMIAGELMVAFYVFWGKSKEQLIKLIKILFLIIVVEIGLLFVLPNQLTWRLKSLVTFGRINSWEERRDIQQDFILNFKLEMQRKEKKVLNNTSSIKRPKNNKYVKFILGSGPDKTFLLEKLNYDNEYILVFIRYGLLGLIAFCLLFVYPLFSMKFYDKEQKSMFYALTAMSLLYMYPAGFFHSYTLFPLLLILLLLTEHKEKTLERVSSKKNKILMITPAFPPQGGIGSFRITKFIKYLSKADYRISVVTPKIKDTDNIDKSLMKDLPKNLKTFKMNYKGRYDKFPALDFYFSTRKALKDIIKEVDPDLVFITGGPFYILPIGRYIYNQFGIPYIIDFRDPWVLDYDAKNTSIKTKIKIKIDNIFENYSVAKASAIVSVNDVMTTDFKKKYPNIKKRFCTITNGYDEEDFQKIIPKKFKNFTILYTGKFNVSAGFRDPKLLFEVIDNLNEQNYKMDFIHIGEKEKFIDDMLKNYSFTSISTGFLPYDTVLEYCKGSNVLVVISGNRSLEQTGKIFDYLGCEKPILAITNKSNELYKVCKDFKHIEIVNPNSYIEIEKAIKKMYNSPDEKIVINNNQYTREVLTKSLIDLIDNIVKGENKTHDKV